MKKRYRIYVHQILGDSYDVIAESFDEAEKAVREALVSGLLCPDFRDVLETDVDDQIVDPGDDRLDYASHEVRNGELVEVEG